MSADTLILTVRSVVWKDERPHRERRSAPARRKSALYNERAEGAHHHHRDVGAEHVERASGRRELAQPGRDGEVRDRRDRRHRDGDPDGRARAGLQSQHSGHPGSEGNHNRRVVDVREAAQDSRLVEVETRGNQVELVLSNAQSAAAAPAAASPTARVMSARAASAGRRSTRPTPIAVIGRRSGATDMARRSGSRCRR
jgi:hypothetical protein